MTVITTATNFKALQKAYKTGKTVAFLEGASRTGKSWDISVFIITYLQYNTGKQVNICRDHLAKLKKTTYRTFRKVWQQFNLPMSQFNKTATEIHLNGNIITFVGINDDPMTAFGLESDILWINEGINITEESYNNLKQRTTDFLIVDYNPIYTEHWIYKKATQKDAVLHKTTIFDNWKYAPDKAKAQIISYAHPEEVAYEQAQKIGISFEDWEQIIENNVQEGTANLYMWRVMGLGMRAAGEGAIFRDFKIYSVTPEHYTWQHYGLDFGYASDETALVKVTKVENKLYVEQKIYSTGLLINKLAELIKEVGAGKEMIVCDTAPPQNSYELIARNIAAQPYPWKKAGSVAWGIQVLQQYDLYIHEDSLECQNEIRNYKWKKDSKGNYRRNSLGQRIPEDGNDHTIDALRYAATVYMDPPTSFGSSEEDSLNNSIVASTILG